MDNFMTRENRYDKLYSKKEFYWGKEPSTLCDELLKHIDINRAEELDLIDLGCGEGANAVYFALKGLDVFATDISKAGLEKTNLLAHEKNVELETFTYDIRKDRLEKLYDIIFSSGVFQYIEPIKRIDRINYLKSRTKESGLNAATVLVNKPFIEKAPDAEEGIVLFESGELMSYYSDWEILYTHEYILDCNSGGVPHKHCANRLIARKR